MSTKMRCEPSSSAWSRGLSGEQRYVCDFDLLVRYSEVLLSLRLMVIDVMPGKSSSDG